MRNSVANNRPIAGLKTEMHGAASAITLPTNRVRHVQVGCPQQCQKQPTCRCSAFWRRTASAAAMAASASAAAAACGLIGGLSAGAGGQGCWLAAMPSTTAARAEADACGSCSASMRSRADGTEAPPAGCCAAPRSVGNPAADAGLAGGLSAAPARPSGGLGCAAWGERGGAGGPSLICSPRPPRRLLPPVPPAPLQVSCCRRGWGLRIPLLCRSRRRCWCWAALPAWAACEGCPARLPPPPPCAAWSAVVPQLQGVWVCGCW